MVVGESVNKIFTIRWCPYTTRKTNCSLPDSSHHVGRVSWLS